MSHDHSEQNEIKHQHHELHEHADRLVTLLRGEIDLAALDAELAEVEALLTDHFRMEELGGYMSSVLAVAPEETALIRRLQASHDDLWGRLRQIRSLAAAGTDAIEVKRLLRDWLDLILAHEAEETRLMKIVSPA